MKITAGVDCEVFVHNNQILIAMGGGVVPGTKAEPFPTGDGYFVQEDGASIEVNTPVLNVTAAGVDENGQSLVVLVNEALERALDLLRSRVQNPPEGADSSVLARLKLLSKGVHMYTGADGDFSTEQLKLAGPSASTVGCDPDFSAYSMGGLETNPVLNLKDIGNIRMAGGHIHIGYDEQESRVPNHILVQFMDLFCVRLGLVDRNSLRSRHYGKLGNFRRKPYGIEYRTLTTNSLQSRAIDALLSHVYALLHNDEKARDFYVDFNWTEFRETWQKMRTTPEFTERVDAFIESLHTPVAIEKAA